MLDQLVTAENQKLAEQIFVKKQDLLKYMKQIEKMKDKEFGRKGLRLMMGLKQIDIQCDEYLLNDGFKRSVLGQFEPTVNKHSHIKLSDMEKHWEQVPKTNSCLSPVSQMVRGENPELFNKVYKRRHGEYTSKSQIEF